MTTEFFWTKIVPVLMWLIFGIIPGVLLLKSAWRHEDSGEMIIPEASRPYLDHFDIIRTYKGKALRNEVFQMKVLAGCFLVFPTLFCIAYFFS